MISRIPVGVGVLQERTVSVKILQTILIWPRHNEEDGNGDSGVFSLESCCT
jgi:hypothetical protein